MRTRRQILHSNRENLDVRSTFRLVTTAKNTARDGIIGQCYYLGRWS